MGGGGEDSWGNLSDASVGWGESERLEKVLGAQPVRAACARGISLFFPCFPMWEFAVGLGHVGARRDGRCGWSTRGRRVP